VEVPRRSLFSRHLPSCQRGSSLERRPMLDNQLAVAVGICTLVPDEGDLGRRLEDQRNVGPTRCSAGLRGL
jgi:hypothetical protein